MPASARVNPPSPARLSAIQAARQYCQNLPVYLDTETTGLDERAEIVEITIIDHQGLILVDSLVHPRRPIPADASRIHGITDAMVANAPTWPELWPQVQTALEGNWTGIYNAEFDTRMLRQANTLYGIRWQPQDTHFFCIMKLYAQYFGLLRRAYGGDMTYRWHTLAEAGRHCNIDLPNDHRSHADTLLARAVLLHMAHATD